MQSALGRRHFLQTTSGLVLAQHPRAAAAESEGPVYRFAAAGQVIRMTVKFFDNYRSEGFVFRKADRDFCLSREGNKGSDCLPRFDGALAVAQYRLLSSSEAGSRLTLREVVRAIDGDVHLALKPPSERTIRFEAGAASDIQAFGVAAGTPPIGSGVWCILRQDLYVGNLDTPFLVIHWKHTANAIRLLDVMPVGGTRLLDKFLPPSHTANKE